MPTILLKYIKTLTTQQLKQFEQLAPLYTEWNQKINVISRKDIDFLYEKHILHSLALSKIINFKTGTNILDLGTGGGLPGIPLAILFPEVKFTLIDGRKKKITVVKEIATELGLDNVIALPQRAEEVKPKQFDFITSRGVASLEKLIHWSFRLLKPEHQHGQPNGLFIYKGGKKQIAEEIKAINKHHYVELYNIHDYYQDTYYEEKHIIYIQGI